jgi:hypothetical protein
VVAKRVARIARVTYLGLGKAAADAAAVEVLFTHFVAGVIVDGV